jgi:catechol 2,3-dioxygenase-like lactoylglutathione lyase family enzyme
MATRPERLEKGVEMTGRMARGLGGLVVLAAGAAPGPVFPRAESLPPHDPAIYRHVAHLGWVVRDADAVMARWRALGVTDVRGGGIEEFPVTYRGEATTVRMKSAFARFDNAEVQWIQPLGGRNAYTAFLESHGDGVQHVAYQVPSEAQLQKELASFAAAGVGTIQSGTWQTPRGTGRFAYLDTAAQGGGMTIALEYDPGAGGAVPARQPNLEPLRKVTQYALVVKDVRRVSGFYEKIGLGALPVERNVSLDRVYRGKPGTFEMLLGWGRGGDVVFEWIQPVVGPSVYEEHLARQGEGFHHLGFNVPDMDASLAALQARGLAVTMSGGWDVNGHQGRFAYLDAEKHGGVSIELLWNKPR